MGCGVSANKEVSQPQQAQLDNYDSESVIKSNIEKFKTEEPQIENILTDLQKKQDDSIVTLKLDQFKTQVEPEECNLKLQGSKAEIYDPSNQFTSQHPGDALIQSQAEEMKIVQPQQNEKVYYSFANNQQGMLSSQLKFKLDDINKGDGTSKFLQIQPFISPDVTPIQVDNHWVSFQQATENFISHQALGSTSQITEYSKVQVKEKIITSNAVNAEVKDNFKSIVIPYSRMNLLESIRDQPEKPRVQFETEKANLDLVTDVLPEPQNSDNFLRELVQKNPKTNLIQFIQKQHQPQQTTRVLVLQPSVKKLQIDYSHQQSINEISECLKPQLQTQRSAVIQKSLTSSPVKLSRKYSNQSHQAIETSVIQKSLDETGKKKINNFILMQELGKGGFGKVKLAYNEEQGKYFALKIADKSKLKRKLLTRNKSAYTLLEQEIAILKKLDHQNIVKLYEVIDDPDQDKLYLVMDLIQKGAINSKTFWQAEGHIIDWDSGEKAPRIELEKLRKYTRDFLLGLDYLHNYARIIHRDIKPDNLLIDQHDNLKIADFGVSHMIENEDEEIKGETGTKTFLPPEVFEGKIVKGKSADIWAAGITFYLLSFGQPPFNGKTLEQLKEQIITCHVDFPTDCDPALKDFISICLQKEPSKRATLEQLMDHNWPTNNGQLPTVEQDFDEETLVISDQDLHQAITRLTFKATVKLTVKLKHHLYLTRQKIKSRTINNKLE